MSVYKVQFGCVVNQTKDCPVWSWVSLLRVTSSSVRNDFCQSKLSCSMNENCLYMQWESLWFTDHCISAILVTKQNCQQLPKKTKLLNTITISNIRDKTFYEAIKIYQVSELDEELLGNELVWWQGRCDVPLNSRSIDKHMTHKGCID